MASASEFRVELVSESGGEDGPQTAVVQVWGEVDIETSPMLADVVQNTARPGIRVVVDMSTVEFIDSSGISALLVGAKRSREGGGAFVVRNPSPRVRKVFHVLGLDGNMPIEENES